MEQRLLELEKRISYLEKYMDELNSVIIEQQSQLDRCRKALLHLQPNDQESPIDPSSSHDEKPPHY